MENTFISQSPKSRTRSATIFGGINRASGLPLGEWDTLQDMDLTAYPALRTCLPYSFSNLPAGITGFTFRNGQIVYTVSDGIYIGGKKIALDGISAGEKTLVSMGAYIVILPDWIVVNASDSKKPVITAKGTSLTGNLFEYNQNQTYPTVSIYKLFYIDVPEPDVTASGLAVGDTVKLTWSVYNKSYSKQVTITSIDTEAYTGEGMISINFDVTEFPNTQYFYTLKKAMDRFYVPRIVGATIQRVSPKLDYVVEYNNRLWGCSSKAHEIYCSKLGDPLTWGDFSGISTDSWTATVGTDGDFTGACVYNGCVLFFKEDCVHSVYGTKASNFTVTTYTVRGVQKGSSKSLCISEGLLYYKAPEGIFTFNGSASSRADGKLSCDITRTAVGTADDRFIVMLMDDGKAYYYDKLHSAWYTRKLSDAVSAHNINGKLYAVTKDRNGVMHQVLLAGVSSMGKRQAVTTFEAVSGELCRGEAFTVIRKLRMSLEKWQETEKSATEIALSVQYDGGDWQTIFEDTGADTDNAIAIVPIIPMRCQRLRIRISGKLTVSESASDMPYLSLYGIYMDTEEASEIGGKH